MNFKNQTKFHIHGLNQEKLLSDLCKTVSLNEIERKEKNETTFECSYFEYKKVERFLKNRNVKIVSIKHFGLAYNLKKILTSYGLILAVLLFSVFYFVQNQFILQYEINGVDRLSEIEVMDFVKENYSRQKNKISTDEIEMGLVDEFEEISFVSVIIRGQTLIINIKEKLLPEEIYGEFEPVIAEFDGKVTDINLISGTMNVKVDEYVKKGDALVLPYFLDGNGEVNPVKPSAEITFEVYGEGEVVHYDHNIEIRRTGNSYENREVQLFGLTIYANQQESNFDLFETEEQIVNLTNSILPLKLKRTICYELEEFEVNETFEEAEEKILLKAREKALLNSDDYAIIKDEFYTVRHFEGGASVNYVIVYEKTISIT